MVPARFVSVHAAPRVDLSLFNLSRYTAETCTQRDPPPISSFSVLLTHISASPQLTTMISHLPIAHHPQLQRRSVQTSTNKVLHNNTPAIPLPYPLILPRLPHPPLLQPLLITPHHFRRLLMRNMQRLGFAHLILFFEALPLRLLRYG
jgi:hypothetical protein